MTKEQKQDYTLRITQANRSGIIVLVYEIALSYIDSALEAYKRGDMEAFGANCRYANNCVGDLLESLNFDYEPAYPLMRIYVYLSKLLALAPIKKDAGSVEVVKRLMGKLKKSFDDIAAQDDSEPLMSNTQDVYAGLTYGKTSLNENIGGGTNRGFTV